MKKRRVAVLYTHPLFGRGVAQLLRADEQLEVTCLKASLAEAADELKRLKPYAVVAEGCQGDHLLHETVRDLPAALFIAVRIDDDLMDVYQSRQVVSALPENLVRAVRLGLKDHPREQPSIGD